MNMVYSELGRLCEIQSGGTPSRARQEYYGGTIPWAKIDDLNEESGVVKKTKESITSAGLDAIRGRLFPAGTLLFAIYGSVGKMAWAGKEMTTNQAILGIRIKDEAVLHASYLKHWLSSQKKNFEREANGATQKNLSAGYVRSLQVPLPSLDEQKRIAAVLEKADSLRRKRQEALRLADDFLRAAYIELCGDPVANPSGQKSVEFGDLVISTKLGLVRSSEEFGWNLPVPYLRMDSISSDGKILLSKIQGTSATSEEIAEYGLQDGDFLFNTRNSRELVGKTAVWYGKKGVVFNNNVMRVRFKDEIAPEVVAMQFRLPAVKNELESRKSGTTSVFAVYYKDLRTLPILVPALEQQAKFVKLATQVRQYLCKIDTMIDDAERLARSLAAQVFA